MIGRLIERLFVQVRADMSDLSRDLQQGVSQTRTATKGMALSWGQVSSQVTLLTKNLSKGKITQAQYTSQMNRLASTMKMVAGSYGLAQKQVWGYAAAARAASGASTTAFNAAPVKAFTRSAGQARMQMMNLGYQINDVGMTLATGMNPLTVLIQQGSQILQIYAGQGGLTQAFKDISRLLLGVARVAWPIGVVVAAIQGMTYEINKAQEVTVGFGDTAKAVFQVTAGAITKFLRPAIQLIGGYFKVAWDFVVTYTKLALNTVVKGTRLTAQGVKAAIAVIPGYFEGYWSLAIAHTRWAMHDIVAGVGSAMGAIGELFNDTFGTDLNTNPLSEIATELNKSGNDWAVKADEAFGRAGDAIAEFNREAGEITNSDPLGAFFDLIKAQATENALARIAEGMEDVGSRAGNVADKVRSLMEELQASLETSADNLAGVFGESFERLAGKGRLTFSAFIDDLNTLIIRSTSQILQQELSNVFQSMVLNNGGLGSVLGNVFSGLFSGGIGARARGGVEMPWRDFVAGEEGAELISQDGPSGARRVKTAGQTRHAMNQAFSASGRGALPGAGSAPVFYVAKIDARGAQEGVAAQITSALRQAAPVIVSQSVTAVKEAEARGE